MTRLHIVIPVFNGWEQTQICLTALRSSTYTDFEIIVVDHGSTDATKEKLPTEYPEVVHILGEPSLWWTGASNLGIRTALDRGADSIMLLNNDCYVGTSTIERLMGHREQAGEAIVAPVQRDSVTKQILCVQATTCYLFGFPTVIPPWRRLDPGSSEQLLPTKLIIGGRGVVIPTTVFRRVGLLDEDRLPHYGSDNDFYLRCRGAGVPLFIAPNTIVDIDQRTTTRAADLTNMTFTKFIETFQDRRSHRNIQDLTALFKLHYPIRGFHYIGVGLNLFRYLMIYGWSRFTRLLGLT